MNLNVSGVLLNRCYKSPSPCYLSFREYLSRFFTFAVSQVLKTILSHTETQTQTHTCYSHISKFPQDFLPKRGTVCLCRSVLQTGCLQQQHPWCSGIVTSPLFHQLTCVSHLIGFYHLSPVFGPIFFILFYIKTQSKAFLVPLNL